MSSDAHQLIGHFSRIFGSHVKEARSSCAHKLYKNRLRLPSRHVASLLSSDREFFAQQPESMTKCLVLPTQAIYTPQINILFFLPFLSAFMPKCTVHTDTLQNMRITRDTVFLFCTYYYPLMDGRVITGRVALKITTGGPARYWRKLGRNTEVAVIGNYWARRYLRPQQPLVYSRCYRGELQAYTVVTVRPYKVLCAQSRRSWSVLKSRVQRSGTNIQHIPRLRSHRRLLLPTKMAAICRGVSGIFSLLVLVSHLLFQSWLLYVPW